MGRKVQLVIGIVVLAVAGASTVGSAGAAPAPRVVLGTNGPDTIDRSPSTVPVAIYGLGGADTITASRFADIVDGGPGDDILRGGPGADTATGWAGNDTFVFQPGDLAGSPNAVGGGVDQILGFSGAGTSGPGEQDIIRLTGFGANAQITFVRTGALTQIYRVTDATGTRGYLTLVGRRFAPHLASSDVIVTPTGNTAPVLGAAQTTATITQLSTTSGPLTATGTIAFTDPDAGQMHTAPVTLVTVSPRGTLTAGVSGNIATWTYTVDNEALRSLGRNDTVTESWQVAVADPIASSAPVTVTITLKGINDPPVRAATFPDQTVDAGATKQWSIPSPSFTDPDTNDTITLIARLTSGDPLPSWLTFDPSTGTFDAHPGFGDYGSYDVRVIGSDGNLSSEGDFTLTVNLLDPPQNTALPTITGTPKVGQTLHADKGTWTGGAGTVSFTYQWTRCDADGTNCNDIGGATDAEYQATASDLGRKLQVTVTATDQAGQSDQAQATAGPITADPISVPDVTVNVDVRNSADGYDPAHPFTANMLAGATSPNGLPVTASGGGTWTLDTPRADTCWDELDVSTVPVVEVGGSYSIAADGTLSLDMGTNACGQVQSLASGETATATLTFNATDGAASTTATIHVNLTGRDDPITQVGPMHWPENEIIDYHDPNPTVFSAEGAFVSADTAFQYSWSVLESVVVPPDPAFTANKNVKSVTVYNNEWGFNSQVTLQLILIPQNGIAIFRRTSFFVGDTGSTP